MDYFAHLYATGYPVRDLYQFLRRAGRHETVRHSAQVGAVARQLARRFAVDTHATDLACAAHDVACVVPFAAVIPVAEHLQLPLTPADYAVPQVLHGPIAAAVLQTRLNVQAADVLNAVRYHTTLRAHASTLEQVVFIADKIAYDPTTPDVSFHTALLAQKDTASLAHLCFSYLDWAVREGPRLGWRLHPHLVAAHAWLAI